MAGKFPNKKLSLKTDYDQRERRAGVALKIGGPRNCCYLLLRLLRTCSFAFALLAAGLRSLFVVASIGLVVSAIYPTDAPGSPSTRSGDIHDMSFLVNVGSIFIATILLSASFGNHLAWRSYRRTAWTLTALILLGFAVQFLTLHKGMPYGLANRFFVLVLFAWLFAVSFRLRALSREWSGPKAAAATVTRSKGPSTR